jgi:MFS transporter, DHA2 family, multidrug resistance protein
MGASAQSIPAALSMGDRAAPVVVPVSAAEPEVTTRRVAAFIVMIFGMFMAILDIQIVSASLAEIQAGISASADEIPWVQTSYLIAEVIMIPLSGFLSRALSTRYLFVISAAGFTITSILCSTATSIQEMILWRACQGFIGGGMIPTVFASAFAIFPRSRQAAVTPLIGLVATLAPTVGPTVGGYLTDLFSWHWLFLVNVLPGIVVTAASWFLIDFDKPDFKLLRQFDWIGFLTMAGFLGALEYVLEEGPTDNWFDSDTITVGVAFSAISGVFFFWRVLTAKAPVVDLSAFRDRNFWTGSLFSFVLGVGLYGLTYLYPVYLARVRGYSALQIGETLFLTGVCMFFMAPISGQLMRRGVDPRLMLALGFAGFAVGTYQASLMTKEWDFNELLIPQILRGISLMLIMIPVTNTALGTTPPQKLKNASGLFNLTRNLGGAVGLAIINTLLNKRLDLHLARLHEQVAWGRATAEDTLAKMTQQMARFGSDASLAATKKLAQLVRTQATVMAIADVFMALTVLFLAIALLAPIMRRPNPAAGAGGGH